VSTPASENTRATLQAHCTVQWGAHKKQ